MHLLLPLVLGALLAFPALQAYVDDSASLNYLLMHWGVAAIFVWCAIRFLRFLVDATSSPEERERTTRLAEPVEATIVEVLRDPTVPAPSGATGYPEQPGNSPTARTAPPPAVASPARTALPPRSN